MVGRRKEGKEDGRRLCCPLWQPGALILFVSAPLHEQQIPGEREQTTREQLTMPLASRYKVKSAKRTKKSWTSLATEQGLLWSGTCLFAVLPIIDLPLDARVPLTSAAREGNKPGNELEKPDRAGHRTTKRRLSTPLGRVRDGVLHDFIPLFAAACSWTCLSFSLLYRLDLCF